MGMGELLLTLLVALIFLGPQRLLLLSFKVGRWLRYFRYHFSAVSQEINTALDREMLGAGKKKGGKGESDLGEPPA